MLGILSLIVKAGLYAGLLGAAGLTFHAFLFRTGYRKWIIGLGLLLGVTIALRLVLLNAELAGGLPHAFDFGMFGWIWAPNRNQVLAQGAGVIALVAGASMQWRLLLAAGAVLIVAGTGLGGHTQGLDTPGLSPLLVSLHVAIAAFWVTAPFTLWPQTATPNDALALRMQRFSHVAVWCVPVLFASGLWLAWRLTGSFEALLTEPYGQLLTAKFLLATCALGLGAINKAWMTGRLQEQAPKARANLRWILTLDGLLFTGVIVAIAAATTLTGASAN